MVEMMPGFIGLFCAVLILFPGCRRPQNECSRLYLNSGDFNSTNAINEIRVFTAIAPRHSGSPGAQKAAEHLAARLRALDIEASLDEFEEETPAGQMLFRNVTGILRGQAANGQPAEEWIVVGAHYDTKSGIAENFQGANDSGSGVGILLELGRVIGTSPRMPVNFLLAFFDGEECRFQYGKNDGLHGSRRLAKQLVQDGRAAKVRAVIILDMIGDRDLNIAIPRNSAPSLISALFNAAEAEGTRAKFALCPKEILDDHQPFLSAGMPAIDVIDFDYGSAPDRNDYWHTPEDTVDKLSVRSLEIVGKTVLRLLNDLIRTDSVAVKSGESSE